MADALDFGVDVSKTCKLIENNQYICPRYVPLPGCVNGAIQQWVGCTE